MCGVTGCAPRSSLFQDAEKARAAGETIRAQSLYRMVLEQEPRHARARERLSALILDEARAQCDPEEVTPECRGLLKEVLDLEPRSIPARLLEVELDAAQEQISLQETKVRLQQLVNGQPELAEGRLALGRCLLELGETSAALEQLHQASRLAPSDLRPQMLLAEALYRVNPEEAQTRLKRLILLHPDDVSVLLGYARILASEGRFDEAEDQLERAARSDPANPSVRWARSRLERQRKEWNVELGEPGGEEGKP